MLHPTRKDYMRVPETFRHPTTKRWACFKCVPQPDGHIKKFPISPIGETNIGSNGRKVWKNGIQSINPDLYSFDECMTAVEFDIGNALGYSVRKDNGLVVYDLDDAVSPNGLSDTAKEVLAMFQPDDIYVERSISGTGLHILTWYTGPVLHGVVKTGVECYSDGQFVIMTGVPI